MYLEADLHYNCTSVEVS